MSDPCIWNKKGRLTGKNAAVEPWEWGRWSSQCFRLQRVWNYEKSTWCLFTLSAPAHFSAMPPRPRWQSPCCSGWCNSSGIMRGITSLQPMAAGQVYDRGKGCIWEPLTWFHVSCPQQHFISYSPGWSLPTVTTPTTEVDGEKWMWNIMWKINIDHLMVL